MGRGPDKVVEAFISALAKEFRLEKAILFGSRATGDALIHSDYDLILVSPDFEGTHFLTRMAIVAQYWVSEAPLEPLCYTPAEFAKKKRQIGIVGQAVKEGIEIRAA